MDELDDKIKDLEQLNHIEPGAPTRAGPRSWACPQTGKDLRSAAAWLCAERPTLYQWMTVNEIGWFTAGFYGDGFLPEYAG